MAVVPASEPELLKSRGTLTGTGLPDDKINEKIHHWKIETYQDADRLYSTIMTNKYGSYEHTNLKLRLRIEYYEEPHANTETNGMRTEE